VSRSATVLLEFMLLFIMAANHVLDLSMSEMALTWSFAIPPLANMSRA